MNKKKILRYSIAILIVLLVSFFYGRYFWVYADGTKAGVLNTFQRKGYVFKTYEGMLIQSGFKANVQSNEFEFSVVKESVARVLEQNSGREMNLHYVRYFGSLPWRGMQSYVVDSIYEVRDVKKETIISPQ